jgi:hypothetical protein
VSGDRRCRRLRRIPAASALLLAWPAFAAGAVLPMLNDVHWGQSSQALARQFGSPVMRLPRPLDFGDSYADIVLRDAIVGGVPVAVFFQMDKVTHGLKRIQLEPLGHEINPPAYRAIATALRSELGRPAQTCVTPPVPAAGFQAAVEEQWRHQDAEISAIFRDTTLEAFEGCLSGPATGWCGLHGQILVRITPAAGRKFACVAPVQPG